MERTKTDKAREGILRLIAVREDRTYESVYDEYLNAPSMNNGLYALVETAVAFILSEPEESKE